MTAPGLAYDAVMGKAAVGVDVLVHPVYTVRCGGCGERLGAEYWVSVGEWHALCEACCGEWCAGCETVHETGGPCP